MKRILIILFTIQTFFSLDSRASHVAGGYFQYTCIDINTYQVDYYLLRDCSGIETGSGLQFTVTNSCGLNDCDNKFLASKVSSTNVDFGCGNACSGGTTQSQAPSYQLDKYSRIITLSGPCSEWTISVELNARNTVDYIANGAFGMNLRNYCTINNNIPNCNSSVIVGGAPFLLGCVAASGSSMYSFTNPDGDLITYTLVDPLNGSCSSNGPVDYLSGTSSQMPYPSSSFALTPSNGSISFNPILSGQSYYSVLVQEFKGGVLAGSIKLDGIVFVSNNCDFNGGLNFNNWQASNSNNFIINSVETDVCNSFTITPATQTTNITNVITSNTANVSLNSVNYNSDGSVTVTMCANFPAENECEIVTESFNVSVSATGIGGCISQVSGESTQNFTYSVTKAKGAYCPEYLFFTNRNSISGLQMPTYAQAKNTIWVGDDMPAFAPPEVLADINYVEINQPITLKAENMIVLPSCQGGGAGCITIDPINGHVDLLIEPINCSPFCPITPISLSCTQKFNCGAEQLIATASGGEGQFTYRWLINGNVVVTNSNIINVHDIVSNLQGYVSYSCTVYDEAFQEKTCTGSILGTKRFYEDIHNNMYTYGSLGHMYQQVTFVYNAQPASIYDEVNWAYNQLEDPPYYGATFIDFNVWDSWGLPIYQHVYQLEGGSDFSLNNFEVSWNGHLQNDLNQPCVQGGSYNYTLTAKNCYPSVHQQTHFFIVNESNCYHGGLDEVVANRTDSNTENNEPPKEFTNDERELPITPILISIAPNPSKTEFSIFGNYALIPKYTILDSKGIKVLEGTDVIQNSKIQIGSLIAGVYQIQLKMENGDIKILKLVKI